MANQYIEIKMVDRIDPSDQLSLDDFSQDIDDCAKVSCLAPYGFLFPYGDTASKPLMYFHNNNLNRIRHNGITYLGDDYLKPQHFGLHHKDMAQSGKSEYVKRYEREDGEPLKYILEMKNPKCVIEVTEDDVQVQESDILNIKLRPLNFAYFDHHCLSNVGYQYLQPCFISGYFEGKPVVGMGNFDRFYLPPIINNDALGESVYLMIMGHGVKEDGRIESYYISVNYASFDAEKRKVCGVYYIDGEEPIYSESCIIDTVWEHLDYVDDDTCIFGNALIKIGPKIIHFTGKWGSKGFTEKPRIERHGQAQVFGTFYEGDESYEHKLYFTFNETLNCFGENLKKYGFKVM